MLLDSESNPAENVPAWAIFIKSSFEIFTLR